MRFARCLLCLPLCLLLLFGVFSNSCYAQDITDVNVQHTVYIDGSNAFSTGYISNTSTLTKGKGFTRSSSTYFDDYLYITSATAQPILKANQDYDISFNGFLGYVVGTWNNSTDYALLPDFQNAIQFFRVTYYHVDGTATDVDYSYFQFRNVTSFEGLKDPTCLTFDGTAPNKDVISLRIYFKSSYNDLYNGELYANDVRWCGFVDTGSGHNVVITVQDEETGLLNSIIDLVRSGFGSVVGGLQNIFTKLGSVLTAITELPSKIIDGIKSLFIPSDESITNLQDQFSEIMSDHFGMLYDIFDMLLDYVDMITWWTGGDVTSEITLPATTINLPDGEEFVFGPYDVTVIPDRFDGVLSWLKLLINIICTLLFINMLKNKYEEVIVK